MPTNSNLLLLIIAGLVALFVLHITSSGASSKTNDKKALGSDKVSSPASAAASPASPASSAASSVASVSTASTAASPDRRVADVKEKSREKFSYTESSSEQLLEGMENLNMSEIENFDPKYEVAAPPSVIASAKAGKKFGGGDFNTKLTGAGGQVGPNTTNVNGLSLEGAADYTLGVTPIISKEKKDKKLTAKYLLPKEAKDDWFDMPYDKKQMMRIENENLLAGASTQARIGIDTQGQTLKNASHDLRAAPPNPKFNVGPWMNSTIEPDYNIKPIM
jgi:hypothetical protein